MLTLSCRHIFFYFTSLQSLFDSNTYFLLFTLWILFILFLIHQRHAEHRSAIFFFVGYCFSVLTRRNNNLSHACINKRNIFLLLQILLRHLLLSILYTRMVYIFSQFIDFYNRLTSVVLERFLSTGRSIGSFQAFRKFFLFWRLSSKAISKLPFIIFMYFMEGTTRVRHRRPLCRWFKHIGCLCVLRLVGDWLCVITVPPYLLFYS
jgi:hypothetical protein